MFAKQDRTSVAEVGEMSELMARISLRDRLRTLGHAIAGENIRARFAQGARLKT